MWSETKAEDEYRELCQAAPLMSQFGLVLRCRVAMPISLSPGFLMTPLMSPAQALHPPRLPCRLQVAMATLPSKVLSTTHPPTGNVFLCSSFSRQPCLFSRSRRSRTHYALSSSAGNVRRTTSTKLSRQRERIFENEKKVLANSLDFL
jgi:hypothetical protein